MNAPPPKRFAWQLLVLLFSRLLLNTGLRMVYPFLPELARGLRVAPAAVAQLITLRNFTSFLSPLFGPLSDRHGRRPIMAGALLLSALGSSIVLWRPAFVPFGATLVLTGLAKVIFDPALQAYLGDAVPYERRGRVIAFTELAWAGAFLVGAPAVGLLIDRQGWTAPFAWLSAGAGVAALLVWLSLPGRPRRAQHIAWAATWRALARRRVVWAAALFIVLTMGANEMLLIVLGQWLESDHALSLAGLGAGAGVIAAGEIGGELVAGWSVDRFGKQRVVALGAGVTGLVYFLLPFGNSLLGVTLGALFALFFFFEVTVVGMLPLLTELAPQTRGGLMSLMAAAMALGRTFGSGLGPLIWSWRGLAGTAWLAAALMLLAALLFARGVAEQAERPSPAD